MDERLIARKLDDPDIAIPMPRNKFYKEQLSTIQRTGKPTMCVDVVHVLILNCEKEILIQKRSKGKRHNPRLLDKSLGGHVQYGDTTDFTVMVETVQELQVPSIVLKTKKDFTKTLKLLSNYLNTVALIRHIDTKMFIMPKVFNEETIDIANNVHLFFGLYDGRTKTVDKEATGVLEYSLEDLEDEMKDTPDLFTEDLKILIEKYKPKLQQFTREIDTIR